MENPGMFEIGLNVAFQIVNLVIFFVIFKKFLGDNIVKGVEERNQLIDKLKHAEENYEKILKDAESKKSEIIQEGLDHKNKSIEEGKQLAQQQSHQILMHAEKKAKEIEENALTDVGNLKKDLEDNFEKGVKETAKVVVKKLLEKEVDLKDEYIKNAIKDFKNR